MQNKAVLVTGGAGFIGSHLCGLLLEQKNNVTCVDSLITGKKENISAFFENKNFSFLQADITGPLKIREKLDFVFNLASPASPVDYQKHSIETLLAGSAGVKNMLDLARKNNAVFLQASTSEVYGDPLEHPQKETYFGNVNPIGPRACYDESKRFAEALVTNYATVFGLNVRIARIFNTFGPKMRFDDGRVIPNFVVQALQNKPITVYGKGTQTRSFCYIADLVKGLVLLAQSDYSLPVNLGNPNETTVLELAKKIIKLTGSKSEIKFLPLPQDDPEKRRPDISLAQKKIGWKTSIEFEDGLQKTIEWVSKTIKK